MTRKRSGNHLETLYKGETMRSLLLTACLALCTFALGDPYYMTNASATDTIPKGCPAGWYQDPITVVTSHNVGNTQDTP
jgi:hypothetical protein